MAPIRRYLRITKYSVLEVRIYLDDPSLLHTWFLNAREPVLPRVIQAVRPLVLPKLREERERAKPKAKKQRGIKDVIAQDDFEVSIFLTDTSSRHSLLTKQKTVEAKREPLKSNSNKLTGWLGQSEQSPLQVGQDQHVEPILLQESDDENNGMSLQDFPEARIEVDEGSAADSRSRRSSRRSKQRREQGLMDETNADVPNDQVVDIVDIDSDAEDNSASKHSRAARHEDKKKLAVQTTYDGFSIYGRVLCLVVKRRGANNGPAGSRGKLPGASVNEAGEQLLESWVSTQAAQDGIIDDV